MTEAASLVVTVRGQDVNATDLMAKLQAEMRRTDAVGTQLSQNFGTRVAGSLRRTADDALRTAQAEARLAQAMGQPTRAAQILTQALNENSAASQRVIAATQAQAARLQASGSATQGFTTQIQSLTGALGAAGVAFGALQTAQLVGDLAMVGAISAQTRQRFDQLAVTAGTTGPELTKALRAASGGTISDTNLQLAAMRANLLGVADSAAELGPLMAIARDRAQLLGLDATQAFNNLIEGLGKAEPEILDNLGITLNLTQVYAAYAESIGTTAQALTVQQKSQALTNEVLRQGQATLAATGGAVHSAAEDFQSLAASGANLKAALGEGLASTLGPVARDLADIAAAIVELRVQTGQVPTVLDQMQNKIQAGVTVGGQLQTTFAGLSAGLNFLAGNTEQATARLQALAQIQTLGSTASAAAAAAAAAATQATQENTGAVQQQESALVAQIAQTQQSELQSRQLAQIQQTLAALGPAVAGGLQSDASAAEFLASRYGIAKDEALKLINAQAALANVAPTLPAAQRVTEGRLERDTPADRAVFKGQQALKANQELLARLNANTRTATRSGGAVRLSDQQKLNNKLLSQQETYQDQAEAAELEHQRRLLDIEREFQEASLKQQRENEVGKRSSRASFYRTLLLDTEGISPEIQQSLSAAYEAAFAKSQELAQQGNQAQADAYLDLKKEQLEAEAQYQSDLAKAREEGDKDLQRRLEAVRALERQSEAEREKQILEGGDANVNARNEALSEEERRNAEAQEKMATAVENKADRAVAAAQREGKAVDDLNLKYQRQVDLLNQTGLPAGTPASTAGAAPTTTAPTPAAVAPTDLVASIAGMREMLAAIEAAINSNGAAMVRAEQATGSAVKGLQGRLMS